VEAASPPLPVLPVGLPRLSTPALVEAGSPPLPVLPVGLSRLRTPALVVASSLPLLLLSAGLSRVRSPASAVVGAPPPLFSLAPAPVVPRLSTFTFVEATGLDLPSPSVRATGGWPPFFWPLEDKGPLDRWLAVAIFLPIVPAFWPLVVGRLVRMFGVRCAFVFCPPPRLPD